MPLFTAGTFAVRAAINPLSLRREAPVATHLLIVAKAIALGHLALATAAYQAGAVALAIFAFGG